MTLILRGVYEADFRQTELSILEAMHELQKTELRPGETWAFRSKSGNQVLFVLHRGQIECPRSRQDFVDSRRLRLRHGTWSMEMIQNYAESVGLHLQGIKRAEEIWGARRQKQTATVVSIVRAARQKTA